MTTAALTAWYSGDDPPGTEAAGVLVRDAHRGGVPDDAPVTSGTVQRVQVLQREHRRTGKRTWEAVPGRGHLRDVPPVPWQPGTADSAVVTYLLVG